MQARRTAWQTPARPTPTVAATHAPWAGCVGRATGDPIVRRRTPHRTSAVDGRSTVRAIAGRQCHGWSRSVGQGAAARVAVTWAAGGVQLPKGPRVAFPFLGCSLAGPFTLPFPHSNLPPRLTRRPSPRPLPPIPHARHEPATGRAMSVRSHAGCGSAWYTKPVPPVPHARPEPATGRTMSVRSHAGCGSAWCTKPVPPRPSASHARRPVPLTTRHVHHGARQSMSSPRRARPRWRTKPAPRATHTDVVSCDVPTPGAERLTTDSPPPAHGRGVQ